MPSSNPTTMLLGRWHDGDARALEELLDGHLSWIRSHVQRRLGAALRRRAETGDFVQQTLLQFLRWGPRFRIESGRQFRALLARVAENVLRGDHHWWTAKRRDLARERPLGDTILSLDPPREPVATPSEVVERSESDAWIRLGLELLAPEQRDVIVLRDWEGLRFKEIAERIGTTEEAAKKRYQRAVMELGDVVGRLRRGQLEVLLQ